jgi:hypothetical protein
MPHCPGFDEPYRGHHATVHGTFSEILGAFHNQRLNRYVLGSYNTDGTQVADDNQMWNAAGKISWQVTPTSQLSYFSDLEYKLIRYRNDNVALLEAQETVNRHGLVAMSREK